MTVSKDAPLCFAFLLAFEIPGVFSAFLTMWTQREVIMASVGQPLELDCEFYSEAFSMFNNPIVWKKRQQLELSEINIMGNILPPFLATNRFMVTFSNNTQRYRLRLHITELTAEDSGNYTCDVRSTKSNILGSVTHFVYVRVKVREIHFAGPNISTSPRSSTSDELTPPTITAAFIEGHRSSVRCVILGGFPAPDVHLYLDGEDVTGKFAVLSSMTMVGDKGFRSFEYMTERRTNELRMTAMDDGKQLKCVAFVAEVGSQLATANVIVHYAPVIRCHPTLAHIFQRDVFVACEVKSRPNLVSLHWQIDRNGTTVSQGSSWEDYWTLVMVRPDDVIETRLYLRRATQSSFRKYILFAENNIDVSSLETELIQRHSPATQPPLTILEMRYGNENGAGPDSQLSQVRSDHNPYHHTASLSQGRAAAYCRHFYIRSMTTIVLTAMAYGRR